jgi:hypothetical protein
MTPLAADAPPDRDQPARDRTARDRTARDRGFIAANTVLLPVPLVPEIRLHLAHEAVPIWQKTEEELGEIGLPPPFWAFAWAGGQALARYVLDPETVRGRHVLDLASGSGLVAIAAPGRRGARPRRRHRRLRRRRHRPQCGRQRRECEHHRRRSPGRSAPPASTRSWWATCSMSATLPRAFAWLGAAREQGSLVLIGDPGRSYLPRDRLERSPSTA